tara:strand:+ start:226 stop:594 length:369 start_codon:yes stop_codon:yes gene_type:complete
MNISYIYTAASVIVLILLSGFADSQGFIYASRMWDQGKLIWSALGKSALGFGVGIITFWLAIRYMREVGIVTAEIQTTLWFATAIIGVALVSGHFLQWKAIDQLVAVGVIVGIGWLLVRTSV